MAKKVQTIIKLQLPAGGATPAPPVGPALGQHGVNIMQFVKEYNEKSASLAGNIVPVELTVYVDKSFTIELNLYKISLLSPNKSSKDDLAKPFSFNE